MQVRCSFVLAVFLALLCLVGCSATPAVSETGEADAVEHSDSVTLPEPIVSDDYEILLSSLPDADFSGESFIVAYCGDSSLFAQGEWGAYRRDVLGDIANKYGINIIGAQTSHDEMFGALMSAVLSESYYADMIMIPAEQVGRYAASGLLYDVSALPFFDVSAECFDRTAVDAFSYGDYTFAVWGDAVFEPSDFSAVYFDEDAAVGAGYLLYSDVENGKWSFDRFCEVAAALGGVCTEYDKKELAETFFFSNGGRLAVLSEGELTLLSPDDKEAMLISQIHATLYSENAAIFDSADGEQCSLRVASLDFLPKMISTPNLHGVLPLPSADDGSYLTAAASDSLVAAVPSNCVYPEKTSLVMSAMFKLCDGFVYDEYIDWCLNRCLYNYKSLDSLEIIASSPVCWDFAVCFADYFDNLNTVTLRSLESAVQNDRTRENAYNNFSSPAYDELEAVFSRYGTLSKRK
jgi:hypothetical protein